MVSGTALVAIGASAILAVAWPIIVFVFCKRRMTLAARNVAVGAGGFILFSQVLEKALHLFLLKRNPATAAWFQSHRFGFALYGSLAASLFEEVGRSIGMRFLVKPTGDPGTAAAVGIGAGGIEAILVGFLGAVQTLVLAFQLNAGRLDRALGVDASPAVAAQIRASLASLSPATCLAGSLERLVALLIQIGLSLLVWRAVALREWWWLALAIVAHAAVDFPAGLYQVGQLSLPSIEAFLLAVGVGLAAFLLHRLPPKVAR